MPFEEDEKDPSVWFLDHNYVESDERHVQEGQRAGEADRLVPLGAEAAGERLGDQRAVQAVYAPNPLLVIVDVQPKDVGVPTDAYFAVEEIKDVGHVCSSDR